MKEEGVHKTEQREECYLEWCEAEYDHPVAQHHDTLLCQGRISFLPPFIHSLIQLWFITAAPTHGTLYHM